MRLFGTDGIRAPFGTYPLDEKTVTRLGWRLGHRLKKQTPSPSVILGGDTRESTPELCRWIANGLRAAGVAPRFGGVLPTPAIAYLVREKGAAGGVAVSASHNLHPDNGIKLFDKAGFKWDERLERRLEEQLLANDDPLQTQPGPLSIETSLSAHYFEFLVADQKQSGSLSGLRVILDSANGAASPFAAPLFEKLGAEVVSLSARPDGRNINADCGSTRPQVMAESVVQHGAHLGIAFDGDADRAIFADEKGQVRDGDAVLFLWANALHRRGLLEPASIVATSMSNLGLERALRRRGIEVVRCAVGDRAVVATMQSHRIVLGGEQSGHIVYLPRSTTGDGLVTALRIASLVSVSGQSMSALLRDFERYPQVLRNVRVPHKPELGTLDRVMSTAREVEAGLGTEGRLVLRYSGTEPLARVMIEGPDLELIESMASRLLEAFRLDLGIE
jgi:phosphoglucosamine mutase